MGLIFDLNSTLQLPAWKRDPNADCQLFTMDIGIGKQDCFGDGHYLCRECTRYTPENENEENN